MPQIICRNLSLGYQGRIIVEHLNFDVAAGDYLCIVGANGAGKTTLMKTLLHFHKPMAGSITFGDGCSPREVGYLPQQTVIQKDFPASVREIVQSGCQGRMGWRPFYNSEEKALAEENMSRLGIIKLAEVCYRDLSGGQQQRVLLARALCATRKILLLDEPTAGLDPNAIEDMYGAIAELHQSGITIVMITHDLSEALPYATHVLEVGKHCRWLTHEEYKTGVKK